MRQWTCRVGAVLYVLWGLMHLYAAWLSFQLGAGVADGDVQSKVYQNGWNLGYIALFCIAVAVIFNWRNSLTGYVLNAVTVSITDIGFLVLIYWPGHSDDLIGPITWLLALAFTTLGILLAPRTP